MPTLRSQTAASALGDVGKSSKIFKQEDSAVELASPSPACIGPCTPAQDHEAVRGDLPMSGRMIRRSRRLGVMAAVEAAFVVDPSGLPSRKVSKLKVRRGVVDASVYADESPQGKRKAEEHLGEAFRDISSTKTFLAGHSKLEESSHQVSLNIPDFCSESSPAFSRRARDRHAVASVSKRKSRGTRIRGSEVMLQGDASPDDRSTVPFSFDLNERPNGSSNSDEVQEVPKIETPSSAEQFSLRLNVEDSGMHGDATMLDGFYEEQLIAHEVAVPEFSNVDRHSNGAGPFSVHLNLLDSPTDAILDEEHEEQAKAQKVIENIDNGAPASQADAVAGPSERAQAVVGDPRLGARGRGRRRGGAEASRSRFLQIARDRAFHFAHFNADGDEAPAGAPPPQVANGRRRGRPPGQLNQNRPQAPPQAAQVDWPGPFSTARQLVNRRAEAAAARQNTSAPGAKLSSVDWQPTRVQGDSAFSVRKCPTLQDLCYSVLSHNAEYIASLEGVPEVCRSQISKVLCERRKMSAKLLSLFFQGEVSDLHVLDCTQVSEDELTAMMKQISASRLEKLHLDHCGRALSEQCLLSTIASPSTVTLLKSISLKGAYRLSDRGLEALLQASPQLVHLDLRTCSFLTNASVKAISCCVGDTLESLVLDGCPNLCAAQIVHDLVKLQKLQKLSLAEISGITDEIVSELCVQLGSHLKELVLAGCTALTDAAIAAIGPCCPSLQVLDLGHLSLLTDIAIAHITDNLRQIQVLNVRRCKFTDEALAAFVTASGGALRNLSLNSVQQVADHTIVALAKHSRAHLECLDLSFCRLVGDECLGFLADMCLQLRELRLYGCTQVTDKFLKGHSNPNLVVVGLADSV